MVWCPPRHLGTRRSAPPAMHGRPLGRQAPEGPPGGPALLTIPGWMHPQPGRLAATLAAASGLANLFAAALPAFPGRLGWLEVLVPGPLTAGPALANVAVGVLLLALAAGFWSHHPATIPAATAALAAGAAAHLRIGSGYPEAALEAFLAGFLVAKQDRWPRPWPARQHRVRPGR